MKRIPTMQNLSGAALVAMSSFSLVACSHLVEHSNAGILTGSGSNNKCVAPSARGCASAYSSWPFELSDNRSQG